SANRTRGASCCPATARRCPIPAGGKADPAGAGWRSEPEGGAGPLVELGPAQTRHDHEDQAGGGELEGDPADVVPGPVVPAAPDGQGQIGRLVGPGGEDIGGEGGVDVVPVGDRRVGHRLGLPVLVLVALAAAAVAGL